MADLCLVTGVAGFVGSTLAERLLEEGLSVRGVDCFTDYYDPLRKRRNLNRLLSSPGFQMVEADLARNPLGPLLADVDRVYHLAGQPGVRGSWGSGFAEYTRDNITATQRLLESCRGVELRRFVYASSSSVYGNAPGRPYTEQVRPQPVSPYGVTKLAAEHLCSLYAENYGMPTVSLRYFTVYGPRQRPDMAFHRFITAILGGGAIDLHGDGEQTRDFTFVGDIVAATAAAGLRPGVAPGAVYNLGGGSTTTVNEVVARLERITGTRARVNHLDNQPGDARHTAADCTAARRDLDFEPAFTLESGLAAQVESLAQQKAA